MRTFVDFSQKANKAFPASFLASRLEPGARTLKYETASGMAAVDLLVLSQPHVATNVKTERLTNLFEVQVVLNGEPTDIAVTGRELSSGREARAEHELMAGTWHTNDLARMQVYAAPAGQSHVVHVLIDVETLKPGFSVSVHASAACGAACRMGTRDASLLLLPLTLWAKRYPEKRSSLRLTPWS
jgi:hypothetical protein